MGRILRTFLAGVLALLPIAVTVFVTAWVGFYWGQTIEELDKTGTMKDAMIAAWLRFFRDNAPTKTVDAAKKSP